MTFKSALLINKEITHNRNQLKETLAFTNIKLKQINLSQHRTW